jgi:hypothetical protein
MTTFTDCPQVFRIQDLTPWSWALLEQQPVGRPHKNFPTFYGTRSFITTFTTAIYRSLSWPRSIQSIPPHPTTVRHFLILSSHLRLRLSSCFFPSGDRRIIILKLFLILSTNTLFLIFSFPPFMFNFGAFFNVGCAGRRQYLWGQSLTAGWQPSAATGSCWVACPPHCASLLET